jgi:hypothetical protein
MYYHIKTAQISRSRQALNLPLNNPLDNPLRQPSNKPRKTHTNKIFPTILPTRTVTQRSGHWYSVHTAFRALVHTQTVSGDSVQGIGALTGEAQSGKNRACAVFPFQNAERERDFGRGLFPRAGPLQSGLAVLPGSCCFARWARGASPSCAQPTPQYTRDPPQYRPHSLGAWVTCQTNSNSGDFDSTRDTGIDPGNPFGLALGTGRRLSTT